MSDARDGEFADYVGQSWPRLTRAAVLLGCTRPQAEDAVQSALLKCYLRWSRVRSAERKDSYVYRVLVNTIADGRRRRWAGELPSADPIRSEMGPDPTDDWALSHDVEQALGRLNANQRAVVVLRYFIGLSDSQIADVLRVPAGTVKSRLSRAITALGNDPAVIELGGQQ